MDSPKTSITPGAYRFVVDTAHAGHRLDQYLAAADEKLSRSLAKKLIDLGSVHYDGRRTRRCSLVVSSGKQVQVFIDGQPLQPLTLADENILYRDKYIIVINKPAGMPTQPTPSRYQGTLYAELQQMLQMSLRKDLRPSIGMVQRLDRDTSGLLVFSIHQRAHKKLTEQFRNHQIDKTYWALISGQPPDDSGVIISHLAKRRSTNLMVSVKKGGKYAETRYRLLEMIGDASLVEVKLVTGRSHQIRAHFSEAGMPLLGDFAYGGPKKIDQYNFSRQMLHARTLRFEHPVTHKSLKFEAPLPDDFLTTKRFLQGRLNGQEG